jgi:peptidyl-prolyl cis-trans isomerase C
LILLLSAGCQRAPAQSATPAAQTPAPAAQGLPGPATGQAQPPAAAGQAPGAAPAQAPNALPGATAPAVKPVPAQLPDVLARVNGEPVTRAEFERLIKNAEAQFGRQVPPEQRDQVYRSMLDRLVTLHVLEQEVKARNITVTDQEADPQIAQLKKQFPTEEEFKKALASRGMTIDELKKELAIQKMVEQAVKPQIKIDEAQVKDFYDKNPAQFQQPESYRASHILIRLEPNATDAQKKEARATIEAVQKQLQGGADFATLAKEKSQDGSASNGGDLNFFRKGQMVEPFQKAVESLKVGEVSGIVETQFGYHIIKLTDKQPARTVPLAEVSTRIGEFLTRRAQQEKANEYVQGLKAKAKIEILI